MRHDQALLRGGLDLVTPRLAVNPGTALLGFNYEPVERGYRRGCEYERFDGRAKPSDAEYWYGEFTDGDTPMMAGNVIEGATGQATLISDAVVTSGSYVGGDAAGYFLLWDSAGTVENLTDEAIEISAVVVANLVDTPILNGAPDDTVHHAALEAEIARRRALITAVTGSGPIRGVWTYNGDVYAFRDNAGGTAGAMFKATTSGWTNAVTASETVSFGTGTAEFLEGETLTQGGVTSTIRRVIVSSGTWGGGDAAGYLIITGRAGGNYTAGVATSASGSASLVGAQTAVTLPAGGKYRLVNHNFAGVGGTKRMYFVNGVGRAHEFDGTYLVPIVAPLSQALDKPTHIGELSNHLFLFYSAGSCLFSEIGNPLQFTTTGGAGEIVFGTTPTNVVENAQTSMVVFGRDKIAYIEGYDADTFVLNVINDTAGAKEDTATQMIRPMYMDDRGIRDLSATDAYGDWKMGTVSAMSAPMFEAFRRSSTQPVACMRVKGKDQYRLFMDDRSGIWCYIGRGNAEIMPFVIGFDATATCSGQDANDEEILLVGSDEGMVYEMDVGKSQDGDVIEALIRFQFNNVKAPHINKRYHSLELHMDVEQQPAVLLGIGAEFDNAGNERNEKTNQSVTALGGGAFWNQKNWGEFYYSSPVNGQVNARLDGAGQNASISVYSNSATEYSHTLTSMLVNWTPRGTRRVGL